MTMTLKPIETRYKGYRFRSRLEARWAVFFETLGIEWRYEPEGFVLLDGTYYLPDFYLPGLDRWIEIKPPCDEWPSHAVWNAMPNPYFEDTPRTAEEEAMIAFGLRFVLLAGDPYIDGSMGGVGKPEYSGYIYGDNNYLFCECHECGEIGIEFEARGARISCKCDHSTHGNGDKCYAELSPKLYRAYNAARSARFEHGETP